MTSEITKENIWWVFSWKVELVGVGIIRQNNVNLLLCTTSFLLSYFFFQFHHISAVLCQQILSQCLRIMSRVSGASTTTRHRSVDSRQGTCWFMALFSSISRALVIRYWLTEISSRWNEIWGILEFSRWIYDMFLCVS